MCGGYCTPVCMVNSLTGIVGTVHQFVPNWYITERVM